jgi:lysyl-tRNA synthetase class 2
MAKSRLHHIRQERLDKIKKLRELGISPYPAQSQKDHPNQHVVDNFEQFQRKKISLTGRVTSLRHHGKLAFADIEDYSGKIQVYIREDNLSATSKEKQTLGFDLLNLVDPGDFIEVHGEITKTQRGEISILAKNLKLLTKAIRPLPTNHDVIQDPETIFRRRYLDLATNPEHRAMFTRKAKFWQVNRQFLQDRGFIEVEVPVLEHVTGGADAQPFITHMNALDQDFFMRISTELYQKRLIGGGYEKIFTLGPNFRNEGLSDEHLTEYYQVEWYWAYADYEDNMNMLEEMFRHIAKEVWGKTKFETRGHTFDLADKWERISYPKIIKERLGVDIFDSSDEDLKKVIDQHQVKLDGAINRNRLIDNLWKLIRKDISGPAFLLDEPAFMSPLSKSKASNPRLTERFHIIIAGSELGNGYSELNDPLDQLDRFKDQQDQRDAGDQEAQMLDIDYVEMLEYGMPPTSGYAHSERLFWYLEDVTAREGTLFPALKHKIDAVTKDIYDLGQKKASAKLPDENSKKFVVVVNKKIPTNKLFNAVSHITAGISGGSGKQDQMHFLEYEDADGNKHPYISHFPFIVLSADNSNQLRTLRQKATEQNLLHNDFTSTMTMGSSKDQIKATANTKESDLDYFAVCLFGPTNKLNTITKKFSLYK